MTTLRTPLLSTRLTGLFLTLGALTTAHAATDITFFLTSDVHYGNHSAANDTNRNRMPTYMNNLPGTAYPTSIGGTVATPRGLLIAGDLVERIDTVYWNEYTADYGISGEKRLKYPVFDAFGNHDFYTTGTIKDTLYGVRKMIARNAPRKSYFANMDSAGYHYSWDWDGVHFVNLNIYAGSTELGYNGYRPLKALEFLTADLAANVGTSGRPVILFQHYTMDANGNANNDWTNTMKALVWNVVQNYNIVAILHGHSHSKKMYKWNGIDVIDNGAAILGDMVVIKITDGHFQAISRSAAATATSQTWSSTLILDKTISMGTPIAVKPGRRNPYENILFTIPETGWNQTIPASVKKLEVVDLRGNRVRVLRATNGRMEWDRRDAKGFRVQPGLYVIREYGKTGSLGKILLH
jgi:hypothetical protein